MKHPSFQITIKGTKWSYRLLPPNVYEKKHGDDSLAITDTKTHCIDFRSDRVEIGLVRHELLHVVVNSLCVGSADLSAHQMEEVAAEILQYHWEDLDAWSSRIYSSLKKASERFRQTENHSQD